MKLKARLGINLVIGGLYFIIDIVYGKGIYKKYIYDIKYRKIICNIMIICILIIYRYRNTINNTFAISK